MNIQLQRYGLVSQELSNQHVWPLKVVATVVDASMPSAKIFVYHASAGDDAYEGDLFECVASLQQYYDVPENTPVMEDGDYIVPYYRSDTLNFACRSAEEAERLWLAVQEDTTDLVNSFLAFNNLQNVETVDV